MSNRDQQRQTKSLTFYVKFKEPITLVDSIRLSAHLAENPIGVVTSLHVHLAPDKVVTASGTVNHKKA
jgi:hypothetical protein